MPYYEKREVMTLELGVMVETVKVLETGSASGMGLALEVVDAKADGSIEGCFVVA